MDKLHEKYMRRCLQLAELGRGEVAPNPMVGAVIVHNHMIIGEGYHQKYGEAHAEVNAINSVQNSALLSESTLYVSLEPCAHYGKTPPCSLLIIEKKIPKVVIACTDSFEQVNGKGIELLKNAGVEVILGVLEKEAIVINKHFFTFHQKKRPYILLKWAMSRDGFLDVERTSDNQKPVWFTNEVCRSLVHKWRTEYIAILVGTETAIKDNPQLNVRAWKGKSPIRITVDRALKIPSTHYLLDDSQPTIIFTEQKVLKSYKQTEFIQISSEVDLVDQILNNLYCKGIQSLMVEGGRVVLDSFIQKDLWDEAFVFKGTSPINQGVKAPELNQFAFDNQKYRGVVLNQYFFDTSIL